LSNELADKSKTDYIRIHSRRVQRGNKTSREVVGVDEVALSQPCKRTLSAICARTKMSFGNRDLVVVLGTSNECRSVG
jgi:hypothetical protein